MRRTATAAATLTLIVVAGCSGGTTPPGPGAEVTDGATPTNEAERSSEATTDSGGNAGTSVELPGLPIGGSEIEFSGPSTQCADVSLTGDPLPSGVRVRITAFAVPGQFSVSSEACGSSPPCLSTDLSPDTGCQVAITWNGDQPVAGESPSLAVRGAVVTCDDPAACRNAAQIVAAAPAQAIGILLPGPEESTDGSSDGSSGQPTEGPTGSESPAE